MTPEAILAHEPLVLTQAQREEFFAKGFLTAPGLIPDACDNAEGGPQRPPSCISRPARHIRAILLSDQERDADALGELNRVLFLSPYSAEAHLLVGRIHLRAGHAREAIDALNISIWSADSADAQAWLAEAHLLAKDVDSARAAAERALLLDASHSRARRILAGLPPR